MILPFVIRFVDPKRQRVKVMAFVFLVIDSNWKTVYKKFLAQDYAFADL